MNNKGFTLVELLAVIVILGVIMTMAGVSVFGIINKQKQELAKEMIKNIEDASITFADSYNLKISSHTESEVLENGTKTNYTKDCTDLTTLAKANAQKNLRTVTCVVTTVKVLKEKGLFNDINNSCDEDVKVYVYNAKVTNSGLATNTYGKLTSVLLPISGELEYICTK